MTGRQTRRQYLLALGAVSVVGTAGCASGDLTESSADTPEGGDTETGSGGNETGTETGGDGASGSQSSVSLSVNSLTGIVSNNTVTTVEITVAGTASGDIDLSQTVINWTGSTGSYTITSQSQSGGDGDFTVESVVDTDDSISSASTLNDPTDRALITIDFTTFGDGLGEGDTATVELTTDSGGVTEITAVTPDSLPESGAVAL